MSAYTYLSNPSKPYRSIIKIAAACLAITLTATVVAVSANMAATAQNRKSKYGLGSLPSTAQAAGGTRNLIPKVTMIVPEDGTLTFAERPTLYWYVAPTPGEQVNPEFLHGFRLRQDPFGTSPTSGKIIFEQKAIHTKTGLYRFTLPLSVQATESGADRGWSIQLISPPNELGSPTSTSSWINLHNVLVRLEKKPAAIAELSKAKTNLEKARIFERFGYWYDAFDAYTRWLEANPKDTVARRERANMIEEGLKDNCDFRIPKVSNDRITKCDFLEEGQTNVGLLKELQSKIDASAVIDFESSPSQAKPKP
jgi:hypothetical protein